MQARLFSQIGLVNVHVSRPTAVWRAAQGSYLLTPSQLTKMKALEVWDWGRVEVVIFEADLTISIKGN